VFLLAQQVEQLQADNAALREELAGLKVRSLAMSGSFSQCTPLQEETKPDVNAVCLQISKRLETLEAGLQELAEHSQPGNDYSAAIGTAPSPVSAYPSSTVR
jgi:hypothetical protein